MAPGGQGVEGGGEGWPSGERLTIKFQFGSRGRFLLLAARWQRWWAIRGDSEAPDVPGVAQRQLTAGSR